MLYSFYMSWRSRRQGTYFGIFSLLVIAVLFAVFYPVLNKPATCNDLKQNGSETGIDCGGSCALYCPKTVALPRTEFAAIFPVQDGVYNAVALLTATDANAGSRDANYVFTIYDESGAIINEIKGSTFIPSSSQFAVFESQIRTGERVPVRAKFNWDSEIINFEKVSFNINTLPVEVSSWKRDTILSTERVSVNIANNSFADIPESEYIVVVYDERDEPIAASRTLATLGSRTSTELYFSWPYEFAREPKRYELIKRINPFLYAR